jgi:monovalent cation:H+ antiporter, CPA1 family
MGIVEFSLLSLVGLFFIVSILMPMAERLNTPYTVLLAGVGLVIGSVILALGSAPTSMLLSAYDQWVVARIGIDSKAILFIFLPILLFEIALAVNVRRLLDDLSIIIIMAIVAVIASAFFIGGALWLMAAASGAVCLLLGAVVSTTDPGAVVAIFRDLGAPRRLLVIVEGESLFNDAAAIVLFSLCLDAIVGGADFSFLGGVWSFVYGFTVGGIAGFCLGWLFGFLFRALRGLVVAEITLTVALAYLSFIAGEMLLGASGVVAVVVAGLVTGGRGRINMAATSWPKVIVVWEQLGFWANSLIFLLASMLVPKVMVGFQWQDALWIVVAYFSAFVARAAMLYGLLPPLSLMGLSPAISNARKGLILWGGIRGAATLALALAVTEHPMIGVEDRQLVGAIASGFVLVTLLFNATTLRWMTHKLGLDLLSDADIALRNRVVAGALAEVRQHVHEVATDQDLAEPAVRDLDRYYDDRIESLEREAANRPDGAADDRMALGLTMLGNLEGRIYELRFTESLLGRTAVRGLRATAERLADAARAGGLDGYRARMIEVLGFGYRMRLCLLLNRAFGIERPLAQAIAIRFEELINNRIAILGLLGFSRERLGHLVGADVGDAAVEVLDQRMAEVTRALEALERQYPDYSNALQAGLLARAGLRWEAQRYRRLLDDSIIGVELYSSLARDLDHRRVELFRQSHLDLGLRSQELLAQVPLFRGLTDEQRGEIAGMMTTRFVVPGETIVQKGEVGTEMYFVGSGAAQVRLPGRDVLVANGDFFGELALLAEKPVRMADVVALGFGRLLVLSRRDFMRLRAMRPEIDAHIRAAAGERLKDNLNGAETVLSQ